MQIYARILAPACLFPVREINQIHPIRALQNRLGLRNFFSLGLPTPGKSFIDIYSLGCTFKTVQLDYDFNQIFTTADHRSRDGNKMAAIQFQVSRAFRLLLQCISLCVVVLGAQPAFAQTLIVQGSTTFNTRLMEPYQHTIESMSGVKLRVIPNKSLNGLSALMEGRADLAMISAPLEVEVQAMRAGNSNLPLEQLKAHQIANTRISFAIHPSNPVRKASMETMRRILTGEIVNWRELDGPDLPIKLVFVGKSGGVTQTVQAQVLDGQAIKAANQVPLASAEQVVKVVGQEPGALGLAQVRLVSEHKLAEIATDATIAQVLMLVTLGEPSAAANEVIEAARKIASKRLAVNEF